MAVHPLIGAYVRIKYHSVFAPHVMTLPTGPWNGPDTSLDPGLFTTWAAGTIAGDTMITDLITLLLPALDPTEMVDQAEIWTRPSLSVEPRLRYLATVGSAGTSIGTGWNEATQRTYFMRDADNNALKLVLLDTPTDNNFGKYLTLTSIEDAFINELGDTTKAWASRAGNRPAYFRALTITLNERLRREYHLR